MTTNVSGFITGSPVIDHYGDLVVSRLASSPIPTCLPTTSESEERQC